MSWLRIPYLATLTIVLLSTVPAAAQSPLLEGDPGDGIPLVTSPDGAFSVRALGYV